MTKPNLDEKRKAAVFEYSKSEYASTEKVMGEGYHPTLHFDNGFTVGADAAIEALREVPGEFDLGAARKAWETIFNDAPEDEPPSAIALARWQFSRDKERIALAEARVAELESALEFYAERRLYVNVGLQNDLYTDAGKRARQALKREGGSDE